MGIDMVFSIMNYTRFVYDH